MKTTFNSNLKDNITSAALLAATFVAIVGGIVTSNAHAARPAAQMEVQKMETIVITAPRVEQIVKLDTILVTASRNTNTLLASN
ncbi:MAG: hypothetical protein ABL931_20585 [Usitatibacteraceae bacterium]